MNLLALTSGGIDSLCMLHWLKTGDHYWTPQDVKAIHWSYGQSASDRELESARKIAEWTNTPIDYYRLQKTSEFTGGLIPFRNLFLAAATGMVVGSEEIIISLGIHSGTNYYDCSPTFVAECDRILQNHTEGRSRLIAPFLHWTKHDIFSYLCDNNLPAHLCYSCELGGQVPCGTCDSCKDREMLCAREKE